MKKTKLTNSNGSQGLIVYKVITPDDPSTQSFSLLYSGSSNNSFEGDIYISRTGQDYGLKLAHVTGNWHQSENLKELSLQITDVTLLNWSEEYSDISGWVGGVTYENQYARYEKLLPLLKTSDPITLTWNAPESETYSFVRVE